MRFYLCLSHGHCRPVSIDGKTFANTSKAEYSVLRSPCAVANNCAWWVSVAMQAVVWRTDWALRLSIEAGDADPTSGLTLMTCS